MIVKRVCGSSPVHAILYATFTFIKYIPLQATLLYSFEACLEVVSNFSELVDSMPEQITNSSSTQEEMPPIIACEDKHIATGALSILAVSICNLDYYCKYVW